MRPVQFWISVFSLTTAGFAQTAPVPTPSTKAAKTEAKIAVEAFAQIPFVANAEISPDGTRVAGKFGIDGQEVISSRNLFDTKEKPTLLRLTDGTQAFWVQWVNDNHFLVSLVALDAVSRGDWPVSRVIGIDRATGKVSKPLWDLRGQHASDVLWIADDGTDDVLISGQGSIYADEDFWPSVYRVSVATGRKRLVVTGKPGVWDWAADAAGKVRVGVGYVERGRTSRLLYRSADEESFRAVDSASARRDERLSKPFLFTSGDQALTMRDNDKGQTSVYEIDLKTQETLHTIFEPVKGEVEGTIISSNRETLLGLRLSSQTSIHWMDSALAELQAQFAKAVPNGNVAIESMSSDRKKMLVRVDAADNPGSLYFYNTDIGQLQLFAHINPQLRGKRLAPVKLIQYKARDGLEIESVLTLPAAREAKKLPLIMMPHGGPWARDTLTYDYWAQFLANRGYAVLQPNFRGSTGYGTEFMNKGKGQLGLAMQDDLSDGVKWAVAQGIADPARTCIVGSSYGGYAAMWGVAKDPDLYRCAISISGVASLREEVNAFTRYVGGSLIRDQWQAMTPNFAAVSPINAIARIKVPMLLIHGKKDITVNHEQSERMHAAMMAAKKTVEFVSLPEADHHFTRQADRIVLLSAMENFLAKHNPAD